MRFRHTKRFFNSYDDAPPRVQRSFDKQAAYLLQDLRHPSLHAKKYDHERWQARVNKNWRFYFRIEENTYTLLDITQHPK